MSSVSTNGNDNEGEEEEDDDIINSSPLVSPIASSTTMTPTSLPISCRMPHLPAAALEAAQHDHNDEYNNNNTNMEIGGLATVESVVHDKDRRRRLLLPSSSSEQIVTEEQAGSARDEEIIMDTTLDTNSSYYGWSYVQDQLESSSSSSSSTSSHSNNSSGDNTSQKQRRSGNNHHRDAIHALNLLTEFETNSYSYSVTPSIISVLRSPPSSSRNSRLQSSPSHSITAAAAAARHRHQSRWRWLYTASIYRRVRSRRRPKWGAKSDRGSASFHREVKDSVVRKRPWWRNLESSEWALLIKSGFDRYSNNELLISSTRKQILTQFFYSEKYDIYDVAPK